MKTLEECRIEIDAIDQQIIKLFEQRMNVAKDVVTYKLAHNMEIFQPQREQEVLEKNANRIENSNLKEYGKRFAQAVMDLSKDYQTEFLSNEFVINTTTPLLRNSDLNVGFQGVEGAFGQEALETYFSSDVNVLHFDLFEDVFKALDNDLIHYGIVPIENSSTGAINDVYDLIRNYGFYVVGEQSISISQHLLGIKGTDLSKVTEVYSHPQGLAQSTAYLDRFPNMQRVPYANTAMSAKMISELNDNTKVAIASKKAAKLYGLEILQENIHNNANNHTRFIIIGKNMENQKDYNRISIMCSLKHQVGALSKILDVIKDNQLNMVRIESRPMQSKPWEYYFYIDFEGNVNDENVVKALNKMTYNAEKLRILGLYKQS